MSDTMTEGVIAAWHKKVGDTVKSGDILAEVETDKATMELESYEDGTLLYIGPKEQDSVPVDGVLAIIGKKGENIDSLLNTINNGGAAPKEEKAESGQPAATPAKAEESEEATDTSSIDANVITMPKMSDTMQEGTIVAWHKKVGDKVKSGDLLAEVETDKATMELESYEDGTLLYIGVEEGNAVAVDAVIAIIGKEGADYKALLNKGKGTKSKAAATESAPEAAEQTGQPHTSDAGSAAVSNSDDRVKISPLARRIAREKGIDPKELRGSGEGGRIVKKDIENFTPSAKPAAQPAQKAAAATSAAPVGQESFTEVNVSQMRKTIARRLAESKFSAPHFYVTMEINMDKAIEARKNMNEYAGTKISFNDLVIKATAAALKKHPKVNSSWRGDKIRYNEHVHIGMAVAVEEGLLVPVIRFADTKSLSQISAEAKDFGARAKNKQLQPADWEGNTFTISNLGMFGVEDFTAIINPPDACILAVGGIKETVVVKNGQMQVGNVMKVTLSCDHRVVDGALAAGFLQTLKGLLEDPVRILV